MSDGTLHYCHRPHDMDDTLIIRMIGLHLMDDLDLIIDDTSDSLLVEFVECRCFPLMSIVSRERDRPGDDRKPRESVLRQSLFCSLQDILWPHRDITRKWYLTMDMSDCFMSSWHERDIFIVVVFMDFLHLSLIGFVTHPCIAC